MENREYICTLFDYYENLLTDKQIEYFQDYYFDNLTLAEISENNDVSRNAVHKTIKEAEEKLSFYEDKLKLYEKSKEIKKIISNLEDDLQNKIKELI